MTNSSLIGLHGSARSCHTIHNSDPGKFCQTLFDLCITKGLRFNLAEPLSLSPSTVTQQTILVQPLDSLDPISIPYTDLVLAAGPWTSALSTKLGLPALALTNVPGHSIILQPAPAGDANAAEDDVLPAEAVFAGIAGADAAVEASFKKAGRLSNEERARGFTPSPEFFTRCERTNNALKRSCGPLTSFPPLSPFAESVVRSGSEARTLSPRPA